jgi:hypothetical protein
LVTAMPAHERPLAKAVARVVRSPRPWLLRYVLATVPALILALMVMHPLRSWFTVPLMIRALEERSLDYLLEAGEFAGRQVASDPVLALAMLLIPLGWLLVRVLWVFLEGGILTTYAQPAPLSGRGFFSASWRWFGTLLLLNILWLLATGLLGALMLGVGALAGALWLPLGSVIRVAGALGIVMLWLWFSLARSVTVVRGNRNLLRALAGAARVIRLRPAQIVVLVAVTLALHVLFIWASRVGTVALPYAWWLPGLILQQVAAVLAVGATLARRAGEVQLANELLLEAMVEHD